MKLSALATKVLKARQRSRNTSTSEQAQPAAPGRTESRLWRAALALLCVAVAAGATFAVLHFFVLSRLPPAMLGKWLVVGGEMDGATLDFQRDGKMIGKVNMKGKEGTITARVEVDGKTLRITSINPSTNQPETDTQTIHTLTAERFVIEDRKKTVLSMERLRE